MNLTRVAFRCGLALSLLHRTHKKETFSNCSIRAPLGSKHVFHKLNIANLKVQHCIH